MRKTTIYLDDEIAEKLRAASRAAGHTQAAIIREAVVAYFSGRHRKPRSVGLGRSGSGDLSERAEDLLSGMGET